MSNHKYGWPDSIIPKAERRRRRSAGKRQRLARKRNRR